MMRYFHLTTIVLVLAFAAGTFISPNAAAAASAAEIDRDVKSALEKLYTKSASAKALGEKAKGILVFPSIVKGGFLVGGQYGEGALLNDNLTVGHLWVLLRSEGPDGRPWVAGYEDYQDKKVKSAPHSEKQKFCE
jgi:hypothetical protein